VKAKKEVNNTQQRRLRAGLAKLADAAARVDSLQTSANAQSALVAQKQREADQAMSDIQVAMERASQQKVEVESLKGSLATEEAALAQRKRAIDSEMRGIEPKLAAAREAVGDIKAESLSEIRALRAPPDAVRDVLQGVLILMGIYDTSWVSMRSFLAKRGVKEEIINFDARLVSPEMRSKVEELLQTHGASFEQENAKRASKAAAPLAAWVKANLEYASVLETVGPLEAESAKLEASLSESQARLQELTLALARLDSDCAALRAKFQQALGEAAQLKVQLDQAQQTILAAETLLGKLEGERSRWASQVSSLEAEMVAMPMKSLLAAAFVTCGFLCVFRYIFLKWTSFFTTFQVFGQG
jgi:dynein heavy chain 2